MRNWIIKHPILFTLAVLAVLYLIYYFFFRKPKSTVGGTKVKDIASSSTGAASTGSVGFAGTGVPSPSPASSSSMAGGGRAGAGAGARSGGAGKGTR